VDCAIVLIQNPLKKYRLKEREPRKIQKLETGHVRRWKELVRGSHFSGNNLVLEYKIISGRIYWG